MRTTILTLTVAVVSLTAMAQTPRTEEEEAVWRADQAWAEAAATNDVDRMLAFYDEDAVFSGTTPLTVGLEQLRALWATLFGRTDNRLTWKAELVSVAPSGDVAFSSGSWEHTYSQDGQPQSEEGTYWAVWKKQPDGSWKVLVDQP